mgnify:CR=1 FL=1
MKKIETPKKILARPVFSPKFVARPVQLENRSPVYRPSFYTGGGVLLTPGLLQKTKVKKF